MSHRLHRSGRHPVPAHLTPALPPQTSTVQPLPDQGATTSTTSTAALTATSTATYASTVTSTSTTLGPGSMQASVPMKSDVERFKEAAQAHDRQAIQALLDQGADIHAQDEEDGKSALHALAEAGDFEGVKLLCEHQADMKLRDHEGRTPLMLAARHGKHETVAVLLAGGAQPNAIDKKGRIALQYAARSNCLTSVQHLCKAGSKVDTQGETGKKLGALHFAAGHGNLAMVRALVEAGASIERRCDRKSTPFLHAAASGNIEVLQYLKERGCDINHIGRIVFRRPSLHWKQNAMCCAAQGGHVQAIRLLHSWKLDVNGSSKSVRWDTPMYYALNADQAEAMKVLGELGAKRPEKNCALQHCVKSGNVKATELLLDWGDDPNHVAVNKVGGSSAPVLWWAIREGGVDMFRLLVKRGAKLDLQQFPGSLLVEAASCNQSATVECLLDEHRMEINLLDKVTRKTPLTAAAEFGRLETVNLLLRRGATPHFCPGEDSKTAASLAALAGHADVVRALDNYGSRPHVGDFDAAMECAITLRKTDMVQVLIEFGYSPTEQNLQYAIEAQVRNPALIDLLLEQIHPSSSFADAPEPELFFKESLMLGAGDAHSDDDGDDSDSSFDRWPVEPLADKGVRSGLWPLLEKAPDILRKILPILSAKDTITTQTQKLVWFCNLLPNMEEPNYEQTYLGNQALMEAARKQYADIMAAAEKVTTKLLIGGIQALHGRCISALVLDSRPPEAIALMLHKETGLLMPLANVYADCWRCAIEAAGELEMKGKLKDLAKNLEQQILPCLVQELEMLAGRPGFNAVPSGDVPESYDLILNQQMEMFAKYRKGLKKRIAAEKIAVYA